MPDTSIPPGTVFGRLKVIAKATPKKWVSRSLCVCQCGKELIAQNGNLRSGHTKSCGCLRKEMMRQKQMVHGYAIRGTEADPIKAKVFNIWSGMLTRCSNKNEPAFHNYGGRGITVCEEWRTSFSTFLSDMGHPPHGTSLDRINNDLGYSKSNCRWATRKEQARNTRKNRVLTVAGITAPVAELCERFKVPLGRVHRRLRSGWKDEDAFLVPKGELPRGLLNKLRCRARVR